MLILGIILGIFIGLLLSAIALLGAIFLHKHESTIAGRLDKIENFNKEVGAIIETETDQDIANQIING